MAITTLTQVRAGLQAPARYVKPANGNTLQSNVWYDYWGLGGFPGVGSFDTTLNGVALTAPVTGALAFNDPVSGSAYLARLQYGGFGRPVAVAPAALLLVDRLWHNGGYTITSTSAQNSTTPTWPARDDDGATAGKGVLLALTVSSTVGAGTPTITVSYTNSAGTAGQTATNIAPTTASATGQTVFLLSLTAGDLGVKSVESLTLSATWTSGTINLVAFRPIALVQPGFTGQPQAIDAITGAMPQLFAGSVLCPFLQGLNSVAATSGPMLEAIYAHG